MALSLFILVIQAIATQLLTYQIKKRAYNVTNVVFRANSLTLALSIKNINTKIRKFLFNNRNSV